MLISKLQELFAQYPKTQTYWVAFSGGVDSHVLLHLCAQLNKPIGCVIKAIHINHHLSDNADSWQQHCEQVCGQLDIPCVIQHVQCKPPLGESLEAYARTMRYSALAQHIQTNDMLLTAQHRDDQAETLLLQCLRGAGPKGLAAMPAVKPFGKGYLVRPLLSASQQEISQYAHQHQLSWVEDESNQNVNLQRNYLRHQIMPLLKQEWPGALKTLARTSAHCAQADELLTEYADTLLVSCGGHEAQTLSIAGLRAHSAARGQLIIRRWLVLGGFTLPSQARLASIQHLLNAADDAQPCVAWEGVTVRCFADDLYAFKPLPEHDPMQVISWDGQLDLVLTSVNITFAKQTLLKLLGENVVLTSKLTIRFRQGGERICLNPQLGHQQLKKLFQQWKVPPWLRDRVPLLYVNDQLKAILVGCVINAEHVIAP